ncbi:MAG: phage major tail tube protein [Duganella sp.]
MGLPKKLKNFNIYNDGNSYQGQVDSVTLPKLSRKMEEWRGAGMGGPIKWDQGMEAMTLEWTVGGMMREVLAQWGVTTHNGVQVRFAGAYQRADTGEVDAVEVVIRGRHSEIDMGEAKVGDDTSMKIVTEISYYKLAINGETIIEIDFLAMIEKVNGNDSQTSIRQAIGL